MGRTKLSLSLAAAGLLLTTGFTSEGTDARGWFDPVLRAGRLLRRRQRRAAGAAQALDPRQDRDHAVPAACRRSRRWARRRVLYGNLGALRFAVSSKAPQVQT